MLIPIIGHCYAFIAKLAYPVGEASSCGVMVVIASAMSSGFVFLVTAIIDNYKEDPDPEIRKKGGYYSIYFMLGSVLASILFALLAQENFKDPEKYGNAIIPNVEDGGLLGKLDATNELSGDRLNYSESDKSSFNHETPRKLDENVKY